MRFVDIDMELWEGQHDYAGAASGCWGFRVRPNSDNGSEPEYLDIDSCRIVILADDDASTPHIGKEAFGLYLSDSDEFGPPGQIGTGMRVRHNYIEVMADSLHWADETAFVTAIALEMKTDGDPLRSFSYGNRFVSNVTPFKTGYINGGVECWHSIQDTMEWLWPRYKNSGQGRTGSYFCGGGGVTLDFYVDDPFFTYNDSVNFQNSSDQQEIFLNTTMQVNVVGSNGLPIEGAVVWIKDAYGTMTWDTTDVFGVAAKLVRYDYRSSLGGSRVDSNYYPQTLCARLGTDSVTASTTIWWDNNDTTLTLSAFKGNDPHRVSILYVHYSVGTQMISGACESPNPNTAKTIWHNLYTLAPWTTTDNLDTARVVFRSYRINNEGGTN